MPLTGRVYTFIQTSGSIKDRIYDAFPSYDFADPSIASVAKKYPAYFNKYHVFRKIFITWHARFIFGVFGESPNDRVIVGGQGWSFLNNVDDSMSYYRVTRPFTEDDLEAWRQALEKKRDWLKRRSIHYVFMVAPNKHSIYGEYIPKKYNRIRSSSRLDQLVAYMKKNSSVRFADPRSALLSTKNEFDVFYKTDSHWNDRGGYTAYKVLMSYLQDWFPGMGYLPLSALNLEMKPSPQEHLWLMGLDVTDEVESEALHTRQAYTRDDSVLVSKEINYVSAKYEGGSGAEVAIPWRILRYEPGHIDLTRTSIPDLPDAVMFQGSFGPYMQPYLSTHFNRIVYVNHYPHQRGSIDTTIINQERPDVVIQELIERDLMKDKPMESFLKHSAP
ncbi:MAG: hypothetical protein VYA69_14905, partial [Gemmatimonadota bacterium]|nr:hypothetical protein [Gemmatimonadota bacterium]